MDEVLARFWNDMVGRFSGPMSLRVFLQPAVATFLAVRAGIRDARCGRPLFSWTVLTDSKHRLEFMKAGWTDVGKVFALAAVLDVVYQWIVYRWFYPVELLLVAFVLACVPYLLVRGPVNRFLRRRHGRGDIA